MSSPITRTGHVPALPAAYQEGQLVQLTIVDVAHGGWCVARPDGAPVVFVRHALPGETVRARITEVTSRLARAEAVEILRRYRLVLGALPRPAWPLRRLRLEHAALSAQRSIKAVAHPPAAQAPGGPDREVTVEPLPGDEAPGAGPGPRSAYSSRCGRTGGRAARAPLA